MGEFEPIIVSSRRQPYVVFAILGAPIMTLLLYAAFLAGQTSDFVVPVAMIGMFGLIFYYFCSLRLILTDDRVICQAMWRSREIPICNVKGVERGRGPFGVGTFWIVRSKADRTPIIVNVTNFDVHALRAFAKALLAKDSSIQFSALAL